MPSHSTERIKFLDLLPVKENINENAAALRGCRSSSCRAVPGTIIQCEKYEGLVSLVNELSLLTQSCNTSEDIENFREN